MRFKAVAAQNAFMEWMQHPNGEYYGLPEPEFAERYGIDFPGNEETTDFFDKFANASGQLNSGAATLSNSIEDLLTSVEPLSQLCAGFQRKLSVAEDAAAAAAGQVDTPTRWRRAPRMSRGYSGSLLTPDGALAVVARRRSRIKNVLLLQGTASTDSFFANPNATTGESSSDPPSTDDPETLGEEGLPTETRKSLLHRGPQDSMQLNKRNVRKSSVGAGGAGGVGQRSKSMTAVI